MANAFTPRDDCPVPSVEAITGSLVSSCSLKPPIEPIFEFPLDFPLPTPTNFNVGCYELPQPSIDFGEAGSVGGSLVEPSFGVHVKYPNRSETGFCEPVLDFYIRLPAGDCPTIDASAQAQMTWSTQATVNVTAERQASDEAACGFDFNFNFALPCVRFALNPSFDLSYDANMSSLWAHIDLVSSISSWVDASGSSSFAPGTDECLYDFTLGMVLPPPFCDITTDLVKLTDSTVYDWCDLDATFVSKIDSLEFEVPAGPGDPYNVILTYTIGKPWSGVVNVNPGIGGAYGPCSGACCINIPVITNIHAEPGGPGCDSQTTLEFSVDTVTLQWYQEIVLYPDPAPECCTHFTALTPTGIVSTTGCGGQFQVSTQEVWIPHDAWTIPTPSPTGYYVGGAFDGQIASLQLVNDITQSERPTCECANGFEVSFAWYYPFPQGGYTGTIQIAAWVLTFEEGLLTNAVWSP